jgi:hypothetical protein
VVRTALDVRNPIGEICAKLATLLYAMSAALASVSKVRYVSNITAMDGQQCVGNVCPQCVNASTRRHLLDSGVEVNITSQSDGSVNSTADQLAAAIQNSLLGSSLNATATSVSSFSSTPPPGWVPGPTFWEQYGEVVGAAVGIFVVCALALGLGLSKIIKRRMVTNRFHISPVRPAKFAMPGIIVRKRSAV